MPRSGGGRSSSRGSSGGGSRSGGGGFFSRGSPSRSSAAPARPPPRPAPRQQPAPAAAPQQSGGMLGGGMGGGLMGMAATGMAFGAGSAVGHMAVNSMMGGGGGHGGGGGGGSASGGQAQQSDHVGAGYAQEQPSEGQQQQILDQQENPCLGYNQHLMTCLSQNRGEINICQSFMDMLTQCERDQSFKTQQYQ